ncbi:MAG TPA: glycosyltransferase family 2 protein [Nitrospirales bacterium]|nr:glycosyltransferase family 2 protein [Nitrospirales bacterium]
MSKPSQQPITHQISEVNHPMARLSQKSESHERSLLVVIPCLNEEPTIAQVIQGVPRNIKGIRTINIVVIDDGSTDQSATRARDAGAEVISHATTLGLGVSFRDAVGIALSKRVDVMIHIDGDGQFNPADIPLLVEPLLKNHAHMVTASRFAQSDLTPNMPAIKLWGNRWLAFLVSRLTGQRFHDVSCGFRGFSQEALLRLNVFGGFTYTQQTFLDLAFKNLAIVEVPIHVRGTREYGTSRMASSVPRYALRTMQIILRAFISYRPLRFFSAISVIFLTVGLCFLAFLGSHYLQARAFSPHIWAGFVGGSFTFLGISTLITGFIGDMLVNIRMNQETILYYVKRGKLDKPRTQDSMKS